jgi:hypothetical protein
MQQLKQLVADAKFANNLRVAVFVEPLEKAVNEFDQSEGMRESFRKAASDMAIEAGVIAQPVKHNEAAGSVLQDVYFLQLLAESQLTMQRLSIRYEKLRAAAIHVADDFANGDDSDGWDELRELLRNA